ncbi:NACHT and TPR domain protein [Aspergillus bombycis]|uniref:NACHT and TPR domain protein n=1 Tax=Aspergillus bombycis TaxID=109264 RepID=A0A1F7ZWX8_9EURO|nr:NACHT and TPR domain protein [Aspergillus bombycis]OGM43950.1 NACHT and TPR domain protein [Aspergillus bombycis]
MTVPKNQIPAIYERAIQKYQAITDEPFDVQFLVKIQNVEDLTKEIDARNNSFREFREKRGAIFDVLNAAMIPVQLFGDLAAGGASMVFPPSSLVFGAVTYLMGAAKGVSASYDAIQDLMGTLKDFTIRLKAYSRESISDDLSNKLSDILVTLVEIFALSTKAIRRGRLLKFTRNILLGSNDAIQGAMGKLDKLTRVEADLVGAETLTESKRTGRVVDGVSATVTSTHTTVIETGMTVNQVNIRVNEVQEMLGTLLVSVKENKQENSEDREKALQEHVNKILRPSKTDSAQDWYDKINKARIPGTGDWVRDERIFNEWRTQDIPVMFISGNPGAGKSYIVANMISHLLELHPQGVHNTSLTSVGFFFFKDDNPGTRSFHQALRDLALQISKNDPVYLKHLAAIDDYEAISTLESAWRLLFVEYFVRNPNVDSNVYILFDGVDEALDDERRTFLSLAKDLYDSAQESHLQLAMIGRPHISDQLLEGLEVEVPTIHVTTQKNSKDINQYIHTSIKKSVVLRRVSAKLRQEIVEKLSVRAEGMFLWVNLMLQELVKKRNESSIRKALDQAPKGLKEMLRHVLLSFSTSSNEEELEFLNEILLWVTCSRQPLTLAEVESILRLKSPEGDGMIYPEGALRRQFASFFSLNREDGLTTAELQTMSTNQTDFDASEDEGEERDADEEAFEDVENFTDFDSHKETTTVTFCHASIGDFFRDPTEGKASDEESHVPVGVNYLNAKAHVLKTFLRIFTDPEFAKKADDSEQMLRHAAENWVHHLLTTPASDCSLEDRRDIAKMLLVALRSEDAITGWIGYRGWVSTEANTRAIRQWWEDEEVLASLTPEEQAFISLTQADPITTFQPVVMLCTKKWVADDRWLAAPVAAVAWSYQSLLKGKEVNFLERFDPTPEEIIEAAGFGDLEKNALWYRRCAMVLRQLTYFDQALEYFSKAVELDPDMWLSKAGMAIVYSMKQEWQKAIDLDEDIVQILSVQIESDPENSELKASIHTSLERLGNCYQQLGDLEKRFEAYKRAQSLTPYCDTCINVLLEHYGANHDHAATIDLLQQLADTPVPDEDISRLTQSLWDNPEEDTRYFVLAADAALATDHLGFMVEAWRTAARAARKASKTVTAAQLDMSLARIYSEFLHDQAKAVKRWERIMNTYASSKDETVIGFAKLKASVALAKQFLCDAVEAGIGTPQAEEAGAKLEKLGRHVKLNDESALWTVSSMRAICLGIYYRLCGRDTEARALFKPSIQRGLAILSDDDPENDVLGFLDLLNALVAAGDVKNVTAVAYHEVLGKYNVDDPHGALDHDSAGDEDANWLTCDGPCRKELPSLDDYYQCPICLDTGFCPPCVNLLAEGAMGIKICNPKHVKDFIYVPPRPRNVPAGKMLVDGEEVDFEMWKQQLKQQWGI